MSNVVPLAQGYAPVSSKPNDALIEGLKVLLAEAESGMLQSFIGTGFRADGMRHTFLGDFHPNVFEMAGSLAALQACYLRSHALDSV